MNKVQKREFIIENFKNIGVYNINQNKLLLNTSIEQDKLGNLIIIIGQNNSGKTNILESLWKWHSRDIEESDFSKHLSIDDKYSLVLKMCYKEDINNAEFILKRGYKANGSKDSSSNIWYKNLVDDLLKELILSIKENSELSNIEKWYRIFNLSGRKDDVKGLTDIYYILQCFRYPNDYDFQNELIKLLEHITIVDDENYKNLIVKMLFPNSYEKVTKILKMVIGRHSLENLIIANDVPYDGNSNIIYFNKNKDQILSEQNLKIKIINNQNLHIDTNHIIYKVLREKKYDVKEIENTYKNFQRNHDEKILKEKENEINNIINNSLSNFNELYFFKEKEELNEAEKYKFKILLETETITLKLMQNDKKSFLDLQSFGFNWIFSFYCSILINNQLNKGDIILIDEPAVNLNVLAQKKLREFLKNFSIKNNVTIIMTTHSPFLIDIDYLEEIRLVNVDQFGEAQIFNEFNFVNNNDCNKLNNTDSIRNIRNALTVNNNVLLDVNAKVIFVEGIIDYLYLTKFKKLLIEKFPDKESYKNLYFIPIDGVGKTEEDKKIKTQNLLIKINFLMKLLIWIYQIKITKKFLSISKI